MNAPDGTHISDLGLINVHENSDANT